jgi:drug/metabolite transporter (DMT)-like permease
MKNRHLKHLTELCFATLVISSSGVLARHIDMPAPVIIWWRCCIGAIALFLLCYFKKVSFKLNTKKDRLPFFISSLFLGIHWVTYFYALKFSTVALGMLSLYTFPVITALIEPFFSKEKLNPIHILFGFMILLGLYILAPDFNLENAHFIGVLFGLVSGVFYALRNLIVKRNASSYNGGMIMFYQLTIVTILMIPVMLFMDTSGFETQYSYLLIVGLITTALGHTLFVRGLKNFSATTASIISSLQPIFGIIMGFLFLHEIPSLNTYLGGGLILTTVVVESVMANKK